MARKPASPPRNTTTPPTLTSVVSYPGCSASNCSPGVELSAASLPQSLPSVCMFRLQNLFEVRIVDVDERARHELSDIERGPDTDDGDRNGEVGQNAEGLVDEVAGGVAEVGL